MVATLPTGGDTRTTEGILDSAVTGLESSIEELTRQVAALGEERDALATRIGDLERRGPMDAA